MKLNRQYQFNVLRRLYEAYPDSIDVWSVEGVSEEHRPANLCYLAEHNLIDLQILRDLSSKTSYRNATITKDGIDLLADDGGLTAILGVATVRLHEETIKRLIEEKITKSDLAPADKRQLVAALRSLSGDATKHLTMKLLDLALAHAPSALQTIETALHLSR